MKKTIVLNDSDIKKLVSLKEVPNNLKKRLEKLLSKKSIKISSRKAKGRDLQKWVCSKISELTNFPYDQSDDQCLIHSREMGQHGNDIILRGEALKKFPFSIECKNSETLNLLETIEQVQANQIEETDWLIVHKRKTLKTPIVIMDWDSLEKLYKGLLK